MLICGARIADIGHKAHRVAASSKPYCTYGSTDEVGVLDRVPMDPLATGTTAGGVGHGGQRVAARWAAARAPIPPVGEQKRAGLTGTELDAACALDAVSALETMPPAASRRCRRSRCRSQATAVPARPRRVHPPRAVSVCAALASACGVGARTRGQSLHKLARETPPSALLTC